MMTENSYKINLPWTEEHEAYCFQHHIPPAAKLIWQCLMREGEIGTEIEPDLAKINAWVAKVRGKPYAHNYLKKMFDLLVEVRVVQVFKQYSWKIYKLLVRPLEWLKPLKKTREKKLHNSNSSYNSPASNNEAIVTGNVQQQQSNIDSNLATLTDEGILFNSEEQEVLDRPENEIKLAIIMFKLQGGFEKIENPEGWIRTCLRKRIWEHPSNYRRLLQKYGNSTEWDELFPSG